jgi:tRNA-(ms[2]io[6]A)-hydroxylase
MFLNFARKYAKKVDVNKRWQEFLDYEATLMEKYGKQGTMHG